MATLAFGTVLLFSAVQGKVWYTAHVVGVALALVYAWSSIEARHPVIAGLALGAAAMTRTPMAFMFPLFVFEAWRMAARRVSEAEGPEASASGSLNLARGARRSAGDAAAARAVRDPDRRLRDRRHDLQLRPVRLADRVRPQLPRRPPADADRAVRPRELPLPRAQPRRRVHAAARAAAPRPVRPDRRPRPRDLGHHAGAAAAAVAPRTSRRSTARCG